MNKQQIELFFETLQTANPQPVTELEYTSVFELLAAVLLSAQATDVGVNKATRRLLFLQSLLGNFLFSICMLYGVSMTSAVASGIILSCIPAAVALLSRIFLGERLTSRGWLAVACAALGTGLATLSKPEHPTQIARALQPDLPYSTWLGNALVLASVLCEAAYVVIGKRLTEALPARRITAIINLWGLALMTPLGLSAALTFDFYAVTPPQWLLLLFYALAASMGTVWLWMRGLRAVPAAQAGVFTVMLPISAALIGVSALGERMSPVQGLAFAIALLGVFLATMAPQTRQRGKKSNMPL